MICVSVKAGRPPQGGLPWENGSAGTMKSAGKVLSVLSLYTAGRNVWSPERAARQLDVSLATGYRYFNTLVACGMLERLQRNRYVLGPAIVELDRRVRAADPVLAIARPIMVRAAQARPPARDGPAVPLFPRTGDVHPRGEQPARRAGQLL